MKASRLDAVTIRSREIDLAREAGFMLGIVQVQPSVRQVRYRGVAVTVEPRVMQTLVALAQAGHEVVSRDELVLRCWGGRIVGDNAINRVISLLRTLAATHCGGTFGIETITKVGYRLTLGQDVALPDEKFLSGQSPDLVPTVDPSTAAKPWLMRRALIGAGLVGGGLAAFGLGTLALQHRPSATARALFQKGIDAQRQGLSDQTEQAISFLREAVLIDPAYAEAWGALALSYRHKLENDATIDQVMLSRWIESAAGRALALAPDNADAQIARMMIRPNYRNWGQLETDFRAARRRFPDHWLLRGTLGRLMYDVGRWSAGIPLFEDNIRHDPFLPVSRVMLGEGLWNAGRLQEADEVLTEARRRWPLHPFVWGMHVRFFALGGRPATALAMLRNADERPPMMTDKSLESRITWTTALISLAPADVAAAAAVLIEIALGNAEATPSVVPVLVALGHADDVPPLLDRYFLGTSLAGRSATPITRLTRRDTAFLFSAPMAPFRDRQYFTRLLQTIGLHTYWRKSHTLPDYRNLNAAI